eukprot:3955402-Amphidinium_carterae.1
MSRESPSTSPSHKRRAPDRKPREDDECSMADVIVAGPAPGNAIGKPMTSKGKGKAKVTMLDLWVTQSQAHRMSLQPSSPTHLLNLLYGVSHQFQGEVNVQRRRYAETLQSLASGSAVTTTTPTEHEDEETESEAE